VPTVIADRIHEFPDTNIISIQHDFYTTCRGARLRPVDNPPHSSNIGAQKNILSILKDYLYNNRI
jgi:hypothetical protein